MANLDRGEVAINGVQYPVATGKHGERLRKMSTRASQPGDPGDLVMAEWAVSGPDFNSYEEIPLGQPQGYLGRDYGTNTDGRWEGLDQLGPLINTVTLSAYDNPHNVAFVGGSNANLLGSTFVLGGAEIPENSHAYAEISDGSTTYGYVARGPRTAKINESTMALTAGAPVFSNSVTDILATYSPQSTTLGEVAFGQGDTAAYQVVNQSAISASGDTAAANSAAQAARTFGVAPDRIVALAGNTVTGNVLAGAVTMVAPAWNTVGTIAGRSGSIRLTGFAMDGSLWVISTSAGPYLLDTTQGVFFPTIPEIDNNTLNGLQTGHWFPLGVIIPLTSGVRYMRGTWGKSFGPETFLGNTSPVQGLVTGWAASARWGYATVYNATTGDTYLCAVRPKQAGDPKPNEVSWYTLAKFTGKASNFLHFIGTVNGLRTNETVVGGYGSDAFWITNGRTTREYQDANYRNATSGTTYLTELRRQPGIIKDIEVFEIETAQCSLSNTVQPAVAVTTAAGVTSTVNIGSAITASGLQRVAAASAGVPLTTVAGVRLKPQLDYVAVQAAIYAHSLTPAPAGEWKLGEASGNALDSSGNANHGTVTLANGTRASAALDLAGDGSLTFDGSGANNGTYVSVADNAAIQNIFDGGGAVWAMFKPTGIGGNAIGTIISKTTDTWTLRLTNPSGSTAQLEFFNGFSTTNGDWVTTNRVITYNHTYAVAVLYNNGSVANAPVIYLYDLTTGTLTTPAITTSTAPVGARTTDAGGALYLGNGLNAGRTLAGVLDEVRVWKGNQPTQAQFQAWVLDALTTSPQTIGALRLYYRLRQTTIRVWTLIVDLEDRKDRTQAELESALRSAEGSNGPVIFDSFDQERTYARVRILDDKEVEQILGSQTSPDGTRRQIGVQLTQWTTA